MNKKEARREALERRAALSDEYRKEASHVIAQKLRKEKSWKNASSVFMYYGYKDEVETRELIDAAVAEGKKVCLPKVISDEKMVFIEISSADDLRNGAYGIPEPVYKETGIFTGKPELVIMPCVALDRRGNRAGHGRGYYDRFLSGMKDVPLVCLAYDCQILDSIETDDRDVRMDIMITEKETIRQ